jgi:dipeptidyl-peptidase 4
MTSASGGGAGNDRPIPSFPRQQARTRRFTLGAPRSFTVSPDGARVVFLRSPAGNDPATSLWVYDVGTGSEREVAGPRQILQGGEEDLPYEERARRERSRELAGGITGYACDEEVRHAAFALSGRLWWVGLEPGDGPGAAPVELPAPRGVVGPQPGPTGHAVAFLSGPGLYAVPAAGDQPYFCVAEEGDRGALGPQEAGPEEAGPEEAGPEGRGLKQDGPKEVGPKEVGPEEVGTVTWGAAEFIAAEEMGRSQGFWWAPDGHSLLVARVDNGPVGTWWTADASQPGQLPRSHRYPAAGTADALVTLWHLEVVPGGGRRRQVSWDSERYPYMVAVHWSRWGAPLLLVEQRDHKACAVLAADLSNGPGPVSTTTILEVSDAAWVDWPAGVPAWLESGELLWGLSDGETWRLKVGDEVVTPSGLQVREVTSSSRAVVFTASEDPRVVEAWAWSRAAGLEKLTEVGGVSGAIGDGPVKVVVARSMSWDGARATVEVDGSEPRALASKEEAPVVVPAVHFLEVGRRQLRTGVVLPAGHAGNGAANPAGTKLPVIVAPYGGPGAQRVLASRAMWLEAQWLANQGFAVVVADGRGSPGRGPAFEHEVYRDLATPPLEDQVEALYAAAEAFPELDLNRVGIRGWSFGGYLSALAVLARPDVFHAAVAGAPVSDWRWYDTYYTERFLGRPQDEPAVYERTSLLALAPRLSRPLLLVHGLVDDNVFAVHTLLLSGELLAAGRPHSVLPLPAITHVAAREDIAENLLLAQVEFFRQALSQPVSS